MNQLKPSTHYTFEVSGLTEVGKGKFSTATIQSGVEPVLPSPPSRLAVSNIEPFSSGKCYLIKISDFLHRKILDNIIYLLILFSPTIYSWFWWQLFHYKMDRSSFKCSKCYVDRDLFYCRSWCQIDCCEKFNSLYGISITISGT